MYSAEARPVPQNPWHHFFSPNAAPAHPERVEGHNDEEGDHHANRSQRQAASEPYGGSMRASSSSQSTALSSSPAAMFLSAFVAAPQPALKPDDEGQVISGYTLGPIVGYGASSIIRKATSSSGGVSAVKIIRRSDLVKAGNAPHARRRLQHEASVWAMLSHEHILPLFSAVHTPYADYFFTLLCPAGTLFDILQRDGTPALLQDDAGMMFRQVVRGLRYLHEEARYVHRDMKLENVLVDEMGVCKIGDFGMTRRIDSGNGASTNATVSESEEEDELDQQQASLNDLFHPVVQRAVSLTVPSNRKTARTHSSVVHPTDHNRFPGGVSRFNTVSARHRNSTNSTTASLPSLTFQPGSLPYAAPELLLPHTSENLKPHPCQDIWALGVMLYALLTGKLPFNDSFEPRLQMKILNGQYDVPNDIGRGAERILQGCLERTIGNRWTIAMVDEVAWGVGWGAEGDDANHLDGDDEEINHKPSAPTATSSWTSTTETSASASRSRSRNRPPMSVTVPDYGGAGLENNWQLEEQSRSRASIDAATRRSSSRTKRSLSRAPVLADRSTSTRSKSRSAAPRVDTLTATGMISSCSYESTNTATSSSSAYYEESESALLISPTSSTFSSSPILQRGRRGRWITSTSRSHSRSASPSMVPPTPQDGPMMMLSSPTDDLRLDDVPETDADMEAGVLDAGTGMRVRRRGRSTIRSTMGAAPEDEDERAEGVHVRVQVGGGGTGKAKEVGWVSGGHGHENDVDKEDQTNTDEHEHEPNTMTSAMLRGPYQSHRPSSSPPTQKNAKPELPKSSGPSGVGVEGLSLLSASAAQSVIQRSRSAEYPPSR